MNLLSNGDMGTAGQGWTVYGGGTYDSGAVKFTGDSQNEWLRFSQEVALNLPGVESYILSGWVKANAVPDNKATGDTEEEKQAYAQSTEKKCGLRATINYTDNT